MAGSLITPVLLAWLAGVAWQLQQENLLLPWQQAGVAIVVLLLFGLSRRVGRTEMRLLLLLLAAGALAYVSTDWRAARFRAQALAPELEGRDLSVVGRVAAMPRQSEAGVRFRFAVEQAWNGQTSVDLPPLLDLGWYGGVWTAADGLPELHRTPLPVRAGDRWRFTVRLKAPHGTRNPHGFDYELWLWEQGVQATGYVRASPRDLPPLRLEETWRYPVERARQHVRDAIYARLGQAAGSVEQTSLVQRQAGVVAALVTGDQRAIERTDWDVFRALGISHLLSISGLHITMFAWLAIAVIGSLWRRSGRLCLWFPAPHAALLGGLLLAWAYAIFSGWGVPAQRTVLMLATITLLRLAGQRWPWLPLWLLAGAVVVLMDPWALLQAGFWLSFVAVGVLFVSEAGDARAGHSPARPRWQALLREQAVVTLALAPMTLLLFGQVSLVGFLANLLAIPWMTLLVTPLAMLGVLWSPLWDLAAWALHGLLVLAQPLANWSYATLSVAQGPWWAGVAGMVGAVLLVMHLPWSVRSMGLPLFFPVLFWQAPRPLPGQFDLLAVDVGQGNAVLVQTAHHALLYDAGPRYSRESDAGHRVLLPLLRALDMKIDRLMLSHRDTDHTGGAAAVLGMQTQADILSSVSAGDGLVLPRLPAPCLAGQSWVWDGVRFDVLHPEPDDYGAVTRSNALSCVLRISNGAQSVLLAGDIEQKQEAQLVRSGVTLKSDLLLVPHHGSKTSSSADFLDAVAPELALVQAGYRNRFGHPAEVVSARYAARGIALFESSRCGAMHWKSVQAKVLRCERQTSPRYWQHQSFSIPR